MSAGSHVVTSEKVLIDTDGCRSEQTAGKWLLALLWRKLDYQAWSIYQAAGKLTCLLNRVVGFLIQMRRE